MLDLLDYFYVSTSWKHLLKPLLQSQLALKLPIPIGSIVTEKDKQKKGKTYF